MRTLAVALLTLVVSTGLAEAHHGRHHHRNHFHAARSRSVSDGSNAAAARRQGLPWCGAFMADIYRFSGSVARELWIAANWAHIGQGTSPHPGAVVVFRHHVGKLVRHVAGNTWIVLSGNDGRAVRERPRSISGAIAFRDI